MKATLRRSGRYMVTFRTAHHVDGVDIALMILIYRSIGYHAPDEIGDPWSRRGIERYVRQVLTAHGSEASSAGYHPDWRDDYEDFGGRVDYLDKAVAWAAGLVRQHFPDLAGPALDAWERGELDDE